MDDKRKLKKWFIEHQTQLCKKYCGQHIVIVDCKVIAHYDDRNAAIDSTLRDHEPGTFIVQHCVPGKKAYTTRIGML